MPEEQPVVGVVIAVVPVSIVAFDGSARQM